MVDLTTAPTATAGAYALSTSVSYTQGTAVARTRTVPAGIAVASTLPFEVRDLTSSLHVGEPGSISGTIVNTGDRTARGTVVSLETASPHVLVTDGGVGVGDLAPGESAAFDIDLVVAPSARSGARSFSIAVAYETPDGGHLAGEVASLQREVGPDRELFALEASNATFPPDSTNRLTVQVTNRGELAQEEIVLRLAPGEPFTSVAPEAYLPRLEPGASATVAFELSVDEDAVASTHAATVNVTAEATGSDDRATDTYRIQLAVVEPTTAVDPVSIVSLLVLGLAIVAGVGWWWRRRR